MTLFKQSLSRFVKQALAVVTLGGMSVLGHTAMYEIDPMHAHARFTVDHFGTSTNAGGFYGLSGPLQYDPENKTGFVGITIPISSLDTGIKPFNTHLKSADFFDVAKYPTAYFKSTNWQFSGDKVAAVTGELTLLDQTHPVTLIAKSFNCYDSPILKKQVCGGDFETTIDRTLWGMNTYAEPGTPSSKVNLAIQIEAALAE